MRPSNTTFQTTTPKTRHDDAASRVANRARFDPRSLRGDCFGSCGAAGGPPDETTREFIGIPERILARVLLCSADAMSDEEKDHARRQPDAPREEKAPSSLPGPNRFPDKQRYGEALAPGTIP